MKEKRTIVEESFDDTHDIEKHILDIHSDDLKDILSKDLIMGVLDPKEKLYVQNQLALAHEAKFLIVGEKERNYAVSRLLPKAASVVILNRNIQNNPLLGLVLQKQQQVQENVEENVDDKLMEKLENDKRGKK